MLSVSQLLTSEWLNIPLSNLVPLPWQLNPSQRGTSRLSLCMCEYPRTVAWERLCHKGNV
jgi:hypothetical protein